MPVSRRDFLLTGAVIAAFPAGAEAPSPVPPEVTARYDWIVRKWGANLTEEQKADIRRMLTDNEKALVAMRAFPLDNGNDPAMPGAGK
jgi:hypothetical protein